MTIFLLPLPTPARIAAWRRPRPAVAPARLTGAARRRELQLIEGFLASRGVTRLPPGPVPDPRAFRRPGENSRRKPPAP